MSKIIEESSSKNQRFLKKEKQRRNSDRNSKWQQQKNSNNKGLKRTKIRKNRNFLGLKKKQEIFCFIKKNLKNRKFVRF